MRNIEIKYLPDKSMYEFRVPVGRSGLHVGWGESVEGGIRAMIEARYYEIHIADEVRFTSLSEEDIAKAQRLLFRFPHLSYDLGAVVWDSIFED